MPIIASAKKKLRKDKKLEVHNKKIKDNLKTLIKNVRHKKDKTLLPKLYAALDKAAKTHIIHPNKSSRLKSRLTKHLSI